MVKRQSLGARDSRGFSMMEVLVAAAILGTIVVGIISLTDGSLRSSILDRVLPNNSCNSEAQAILNQIKSKGMNHGFATTIVPLAPASLSQFYKPANTANNNEQGLAYEDRWSKLPPVYDMTTNPVTLRPYLQIMGIMTTLQAVYDSDKSTFCEGPFGNNYYSAISAVTNPFPELLPGASNVRLTGVKKYLKIEPIDINTGSVIAGCPDVEIRPPSTLEDRMPELLKRPLPFSASIHPDDPDLTVFKVSPNARTDRGFKVTSTLSYTNKTGLTQQCRVSQNFVYGAFQDNSTRLNLQDIEIPIDDSDRAENLNTTINTEALANPPDQDDIFDSTPPHYLKCDANVSRQVNVRLRNVRPGSIVMCRNLSSIRPSNTQPAPPPGAGTLMVNGVKQAQTFYSTELMNHPYYRTQPADSIIAGAYYPAGTYFCKDTDNCGGLPFFPQGANPGGTGGEHFFMEKGVRYYIPFTQSLNASLIWEPCERINVCGVNPTAASFHRGTESEASAYHLSFQNLPDGCEVHIQMNEVDAGLNMQAIEFREYMQERLPGNKLCANLGTPRGSTNYPANAMFFACTSGGNPSGFVDCSASDGTKACCMDFPTYKEFRPIAPKTFTLPLACELPWGGTIADGTFAMAYKEAVSPTCTSEVRMCDDGELSGTNLFQSCAPPTDCPLPWGGTILNGQAVTAFGAARVTAPTNCLSQVRTCNSKILSGSYKFRTCERDCRLPVSLGGKILKNGDSIQAYLKNRGTKADPCKAEMRTCMNGTLTGTHTLTTCSAGCNAPGNTFVAEGKSGAYYPNQNGNLAPQNRHCVNGILSGTAPWYCWIEQGSDTCGQGSLSCQAGSTWMCKK